MNPVDTLEDPIIRNMERTGYPDGEEPDPPICPVCGQECDTIYYGFRYSDIVGCDNCIRTGDAWEEQECFPGKEF